MGMVDTANGVVPRIHQPNTIEWFFPNLDLQIHLHRMPVGRWLGLETVQQQFGSAMVGLTSSVLHDAHGAFGHASRTHLKSSTAAFENQEQQSLEDNKQ